MVRTDHPIRVRLGKMEREEHRAGVDRGRHSRRHFRASPPAFDLDAIAVGDSQPHGVVGMKLQLIAGHQRSTRRAARHRADIVVMQHSSRDQQPREAFDVMLRACQVVHRAQPAPTIEKARRVNCPRTGMFTAGTGPLESVGHEAVVADAAEERGRHVGDLVHHVRWAAVRPRQADRARYLEDYPPIGLRVPRW